MFRLIWKTLPYALLILSMLGVVGGVSRQFQPDYVQPTSISSAELLRMNPDDLDAWVSVQDGYLLWNESVEVSKEYGKRLSEFEYVLVPYVDSPLYNKWAGGSLSQRDITSNCILVRLDREKMRAEFPAYFSDPQSLQSNPKPYPLSFHYDSQSIAFGSQKKVIESFKDKGFQHVVIAKAGSRPLSKSEVGASGVISAILAVVSMFWIRNRSLAAKKTSTTDEDLVIAAVGGMSRGVKDAVRDSASQGVESDFERLKNDKAG